MIQTKDRETGAGWAEKRETSEPWNGELQVESFIHIEAQHQVSH